MLLLLIFLLSCLALESPVRADNTPTTTALKLKQRHYFFGDSELTVAQKGVRLECKGSKFKVVAKAPTWTVTVFRDDDKSCFTESLAKLEETGLVSGIMVSLRDKEIFPREIPKKVQISGFTALRVGGQNTIFTYLPIAPFAPAEVGDFVYACYKLPTNNGLALQYSHLSRGVDMVTELDETGNRQVLLSTAQITRVSVPMTIFDAPAGYRPARSLTDVVVGSTKRGESEDLQAIFDRPEPSMIKPSKP